MSIHFVLGGSRSGKSEFAEKLSVGINKKLYIATADPSDKSMFDRINKHKLRRDDSWGLVEKYSNFNDIDLLEYDFILLDCITLFVNNYIYYKNLKLNDSNTLKLLRAEIDSLINKSKEKKLVIVSSEIGLGLVSQFEQSNLYRDLVGKINQYIAMNSNKVSFIISGLEMRLK